MAKSIACCLMLIAVCGCSGGKYNPWIGSRDLLSSTSVIALAPLLYDPEIGIDRSVDAEFDALLVEELESSGYTVVSADRTKGTFAAAEEAEGGLFDPVTGKLDRDKAERARESVRRELKEEHGADFILFPSIVAVAAPFSGGQAAWDGTTQATESFLKSAFMGMFGTRSGTVPALSFEARLIDLDGELLYFNRGGIEIAGRHAKKGIDWVPGDELLRNADRNRKSVHLAVEPMAPVAKTDS